MIVYKLHGNNEMFQKKKKSYMYKIHNVGNLETFLRDFEIYIIAIPKPIVFVLHNFSGEKYPLQRQESVYVYRQNVHILYPYLPAYNIILCISTCQAALS